MRHPFGKKFFALSRLYSQTINLYPLQQFKLHMALEKRRSERTNCQSSIIFFYTKHLLGQNSRKYKCCIEEIAKLICKNIRATDVVSIYRNHTILILLMDAESQGAQCACQRIINKIIAQFSYSCPVSPKDFHIKILSFPEQRLQSTNLELPTPDKARAARMPRKSDARLPLYLSFKQEYNENLNLCISSLNGSLITLRIDDIFFWDQELFSKYIPAIRKVAKRIIDIAGACTAILLLHPVMLVIAIAVKLTSPGPVLFKQRRIGYKRNPFTFYKFRSMKASSEENVHQEYVRKYINGEIEQTNMGTEKSPHFKLKDDSRITPLGRFLRKTSLDELPQFFNVLKGEMSLVGPRPPIPYEVFEYKKWHNRRILEVKPGITGLWQVSGRNRLTFDEMVRLDIKYAESWTLGMDLRILYRTFKVVLQADGE
jgi:lipopolysaccharide/colanic/teichoic acid biosynthesis glycosyltransferase